jgi:glycosyltransferase involved in cell wall biosynthesis
LPVIATRMGALPELVNSTNGILVNESVEELTAAMLNMQGEYIHFNPEAISRAAAGRYGYSAIAACFDELYRSFGPGGQVSTAD